MNANIVVLNGETIINLSKDTAQDEDVKLGKTYHRANGSLGVGTHQCSGGSGGITPSGTLPITANGEYDVTNYAKAQVDIPTTYKLCGKWLFKSDLPVPSEDIVQEVNFTSNDWVYNKMEIQSVVEGTVVTYYREDNGDFNEVYKPEASPKWINDKYREVNYGKTPQSVSKAYYDYVNANAEIVILEEWDGSFTKSVDLTGTTWEIASGWLCSAQQGNYLVNGELTIDSSTVTITQIILGLYSPASGTPEYKENWISVMVGDTFSTFDNTNAFTLKITGGDDVDNSELAAWLKSDGKLQ